MASKSSTLSVKSPTAKKRRVFEQFNYWVMCIPALLWLLFFHIIPMSGIYIAFVDYAPKKGIFGSEFVGMQNFEYLFTLPDFTRVVGNTFVIATCKVILNLIVPLAFALLLNEIRNVKFKKFVQTVTYLPHFISWVILASIVSKIFGYTGVVNYIITLFGGDPKVFFADATFFRYFVILSDVWKECGFNSIIYLAALTGINPELYEAAALDGAGRWDSLWHITLPSIKSTIVLLGTLSMGSILNAGFDQIFNLYNPLVYSTGDIIDTWVYRFGLINMNYAIGTCAGLFKSVVSLVLIVISYILAYKFADYTIF